MPLTAAHYAIVVPMQSSFRRGMQLLFKRSPSKDVEAVTNDLSCKKLVTNVACAAQMNKLLSHYRIHAHARTSAPACKRRAISHA